VHAYGNWIKVNSSYVEMRSIMKNNRVRDRRGFTLIEILVVMVIIGLLAALVGPRLFPKLGKSKQAAAKAQIELLGQGLDQFRLDTGRYPTTQEGLQALTENPGIDKWDGPYLKKRVPEDPWGKEYFYQSPGDNGEYDLVSFGKDGVTGGEKEDQDIKSWE
jgi:general secretion pathway protein G